MKKITICTITTIALLIGALLGISISASAADISTELSVNLAEDIGLNFKTYNLGANAKTAKIYLPNGETVTYDIPSVSGVNGAKTFTAEIAVKHVKANVVFEIIDENSNVLFTKTVNIADFCAANIKDGNKFKPIVDALIAYGDAANQYFNNRDNVSGTYTVDFSGVPDMVTSGSVPGISHAVATLFLESKTTICHYFKLDEGKSIDSYSFYVDYDLDGRCDPGEETAPVQNGNYYCVLIGGITPNDLDRVYRIVVSDGTNKYSCEYGTLTYAKRVYNGGESASATQLLVQGLYGYWKAADGLEGTITLKADGETLGTFTYEYGVETPLVTGIPTKDGYGFAGWYSGSTKVENISPSMQGNMTLEAHFTDLTVGTTRFGNVNAATLNYWKPHTHINNGSGVCTVCSHKTTCSISKTARHEDYEAGKVTSCSDCGATYTATVKVYGNVNSGNYASLNILKNGTAVTYDYDYFVVPSNRFDTTSSYGKFYDMMSATGAREVTFSAELSTYGDKPALSLGMRINGNSLKTFYVSSEDNRVYLGDSSYAGNEKYALLELTDEPQKLEIHFDFSNVRDWNVGTYKVYATNLTGNTVSIECGVETLNIRFAQLSMVDGMPPVGSSCALTVNDAKFTIAPTNNVVYSTSIELPDDAPMTYTYGEDTYLPTPRVYGKVFLGWYADEALTKQINSIPTGAVGVFKVYDKWRDMNAEELEQEHLDRIEEVRSDIASITKDFGLLPDFGAEYGYDKIDAVPTVGQHPRIYMTEDDLDRIRANLTHPENAESYKKVLALASLDYTGILEEEYNGSNYTTESLARLECLSFMYLITGDELYGYTAIRAAKNWLDTVRFDPTDNNDDAYWLSNDASTAMFVLAEVYDWCHDLLTEQDKEYIVTGAANVLGPVFEIGYPPSFWSGVTGHSVGALVLRDWLSFCIATYDEYPEMYHAIVGEILEVYIDAPNWYYQSGANFQGTSYGMNKTYLHMISEMILYKATGYKAYDVSFEPTIITYLSYITPGYNGFSLGDDYSGGTMYGNEFYRRLPLFAAAYYQNPVIKAWGMELSDDYAKCSWSGRIEVTPLSVLIFNDPALKASDDMLDELPLVNYNGSPTGAITARSAWQDPNAWAVYMHIDEAYGANHDHKDAGTFQIYYKGMLALNSTHYDSYGSVIDYGYSKQTISANGLLIYNPKYAKENGWIYSGGQTTQPPNNGENVTLEEWLSKTTSYQATELGHAWGYDADGKLTYAYISGDITNAYDADTVDLVKRSMISIATGDEAHPMMFVVHDRIISDDASFKKTFLLHVTDEPTVEGNVTVATNTQKGNNGKLTSTTLLPKSPKIEAIGGEGKYFWVNGRDLGKNEPYRANVGWGRVEVSTSGNKEDSFLNVMYVGDADKNDSYVESTLVESVTHDGAISFGSCVMFSKSGSPVLESFSFTATADGELTYYVTGLSEGEWEITVNGESLGDITVSADSGMARFTAEAGEVTFSPKFDTITYKTNGGTIIGDYLTVRREGDYTLPTDVRKDMYAFDGWYLDEELTEPIEVITSDIVGSVTVYAKFTPVKYYAVSSDTAGRSVSSNFGYIQSMALGDMIDSTDSKAVTLSIDFSEVGDASYAHVSNAHIRVRTYDGKNAVNPLHFKNGTVYNANGVALAALASGPKIDVVMDFDDNVIYYYVDGELFEATVYTVTNLIEDADGKYSGYNFVNNGYTFAQFNGDFKTSSGAQGYISYDSYVIYVGDLYDGDDKRPNLGGSSLCSRFNSAASSEYYVEHTNVGSELIASGETAITFSLDLAAGSKRNDGYIRMRPGVGNDHEIAILKFSVGGVTTKNGKVLTAYDSGDRLDVVIDFSAKTLRYYVNGEYVETENDSKISSDLTQYNYAAPAGTLRTNMFQLTNVGSAQILSYESIIVIVGDAYK